MRPISSALPAVLAIGLCLQADAASASAANPADSTPRAARAVIPPNAWGVYTWGGEGAVARLPGAAELPIKGVPLTFQWAQLEPRRGKFEFEREIRAPLAAASERGHYVHLMMWVAPKTPEWLYEIGVPRVEVPERIDPFRKKVKPTFPYYFSPIYKENFHRAIRALGDYVASLPPELKSRLVFVQAAEGSTGDGQPYKGIPTDRRYAITEEQWGAFRRETWGVYQGAFQRADGTLRVPLLVNGDANGPLENAWLLEHCDAFGVKQGMFSHGYLVSDTIDRLERWEQFRAAAHARGATIFSRGEQDGEWKVCGWSAKNPTQAFYWSGLFALHCKLDVWNVPADALATQPLGESVRLFNRYAGQNDAPGSRGAFCALRRGLDASDTTAFPVEKFGRAEKNNRDRYLAIAKAFAPLGARQGDPDKALGGGMRNRQADDQNDVGWRTWPGNFERHLTRRFT